MLGLRAQVIAWLRRRPQGQDLIEYSVLLGLLTLVVWAVVTLGGEQVSLTWQATVDMLTSIAVVAGS